MSGDGSAQVRLEEIARRLGYLLGLRAALAPFRLTLRALRDQAQRPEGRRQLLALWLPCQERLDLLLDAAGHGAPWAARLRLLRQEVEDSFLDEEYNLAALDDLVDAFEHACETLLLGVERDLREAARSA